MGEEFGLSCDMFVLVIIVNFGTTLQLVEDNNDVWGTKVDIIEAASAATDLLPAWWLIKGNQ